MTDQPMTKKADRPTRCFTVPCSVIPDGIMIATQHMINSICSLILAPHHADLMQFEQAVVRGTTNPAPVLSAAS